MSQPFPKLFLATFWLAAIVSILLLSRYFGDSSTHFTGIADDQEQTIRFKAAVEIVRFERVAGQTVQAGDLIVEVLQPDLKADILMVREQTHALRFRNRETRASMESEIVSLEADLRAEVAKLDNQILELKAREDVQQNFATRVDRTNRTNGGTNSRTKSVIVSEISSLGKRKVALTAATGARVDDLKSRLGASDRPITAQIAELEERLVELQRRDTQQNVTAQFDGQVGSVLFKVGDVVLPFQPIATVHGANPQFVKGYIHESVFNNIEINQRVWIRSATTQQVSWHPGIVESLGSRIVEFPERLKINRLVQAWGREVVIHLDNGHDLLLGEKVDVQVEPPVSVIQELALVMQEQTRRFRP